MHSWPGQRRVGISRQASTQDPGAPGAAALETWRAPEDVGATAGEPVAVPALTILYHPARLRVGDHALLHDLLSGREVHLSRVTREFTSRLQTTALPLADRNLSRGPLRLF